MGYRREGGQGRSRGTVAHKHNVYRKKISILVTPLNNESVWEGSINIEPSACLVRPSLKFRLCQGVCEPYLLPSVSR
jgi:hypothetical protein